MIASIALALALFLSPPICPDGDLEPCVSPNPPAITHPVYLPEVVTP